MPVHGPKPTTKEPVSVQLRHNQHEAEYQVIAHVLCGSARAIRGQLRKEALRQPPIWDIDRSGGMKPGVSMPWLARFCQTTWRQRASRSASEPPDRRRSRTEDSCVANRQLRSAPSAVSRRRLQVPQKASVTLAMTPISPWPSTKR